MILAGYVGVQLQRIDPLGWTSLWLNLSGALLILASLFQAFNLSAALMEGAWALVAAFGMWRKLRR